MHRCRSAQDVARLRSVAAAQGEKVKELKAAVKGDASLKAQLDSEVAALLKAKEELAVSYSASLLTHLCRTSSLYNSYEV